MKLEIKNISMASHITSSVPVVVFALGLLGGVVTYLVVPNPQLDPISVGSKLVSIGVFALLYVVIVSSLLVFLTFLYNILTSVLGMKGVVFEFEEVSEHE
jgi:hypothetical protein